VSIVFFNLFFLNFTLLQWGICLWHGIQTYVSSTTSVTAGCTTDTTCGSEDPGAVCVDGRCACRPGLAINSSDSTGLCTHNTGMVCLNYQHLVPCFLQGPNIGSPKIYHHDIFFGLRRFVQSKHLSVFDSMMIVIKRYHSVIVFNLMKLT